MSDWRAQREPFEVRSALLDDEAHAFLVERGRRTTEEFPTELGERTLPRLEWGEQAEYRAGGADLEPTILVCRYEPDWWRIRYQIAHEAFHWLCTPPRTHHWAHELFAVEMAVRAMEELGEHDYAQRVTDGLSQDADRVSLRAMLTTSFSDLEGDGLYGRAWVTGRELTRAVGWERLKPLARSFNKEGRPDVVAWIGSLRPDEQTKVDEVLGHPSPQWV